MDFLTSLLTKTFMQVLTSFLHNWPFLIISVLIAVLLKLYLDPTKISTFLTRYRRAGVIAATAAAVGTPLCSCGTTAILLGMMAGSMPWAPIIAFMVASPLTSPEELIYSAGLFGWPFAIAFFVASILLGLAGGLAAGFFETRGWLKGQARYTQAKRASAQPLITALEACTCGAQPVAQTAPVFAGSNRVMALANVRPPTRQLAFQNASCCAEPASLALAASASSAALISGQQSGCGCGTSPVIAPAQASTACGCSEQPATPAQAVPVTLLRFAGEAFSAANRLLPMFLGFAFIGYFLNGLIPSAWVASIFGVGNAYSIPLAATLGLPLYINSEASLPLIRAMIDGGMSQGAALAFLITGAGTSIGAVMGALTIARWRVIGLVVAVLWIGAVIMGSAYNLAIGLGLF